MQQVCKHLLFLLRKNVWAIGCSKDDGMHISPEIGYKTIICSMPDGFHSLPQMQDRIQPAVLPQPEFAISDKGQYRKGLFFVGFFVQFSIDIYLNTGIIVYNNTA